VCATQYNAKAKEFKEKKEGAGGSTPSPPPSPPEIASAADPPPTSQRRRRKASSPLRDARGAAGAPNHLTEREAQAILQADEGDYGGGIFKNDSMDGSKQVAGSDDVVFYLDPRDGWLRPSRELHRGDALRLIFFEKLFFTIDNDSNGFVTEQQLDRLFSFLAYDLPPEQRVAALEEGACYNHAIEFMPDASHDARRASLKEASLKRREALDQAATMAGADANDDGVFDCKEFVNICVANVWQVPLPHLEWASRNFMEASANKIDRNQFYWKKAAKQVDQVARFCIIGAYAICLGVIFSLSLSDDYAQARRSCASWLCPSPYTPCRTSETPAQAGPPAGAHRMRPRDLTPARWSRARRRGPRACSRG